MKLLSGLRFRAIVYAVLANAALLFLLVFFSYGFQKFRTAEIDFVVNAKQVDVDPFGRLKESDRVADIAGDLEFTRLAIDGKFNEDAVKKKIVEEKFQSACDETCLLVKKASLESKLEYIKSIPKSEKSTSINGASSNGDSKPAYEYWFANGTTKLGILTLLLFGFVTLNRLYQYMARLSTFYFARADALELWQSLGQGQTVESLEKLSNTMTPTFVMLDKDSETLFQKFQEFVSSKVDMLPKRVTTRSRAKTPDSDPATPTP